MSIKTKISNKLSTAGKHADKLGSILGYIGTIYTAGKSSGSPSAVESLVVVHKNAITRMNIAELPANVMDHITNPSFDPMLWTGVGLAVGGAIASYLPSIVPWQGSIASLAKKAGFGLAVGSLLAIGTLSLAAGSSPFDNNSSGGTSDVSGVSSTGRVGKPTGRFAPPTPQVGSWSRPS